MVVVVFLATLLTLLILSTQPDHEQSTPTTTTRPLEYSSSGTWTYHLAAATQELDQYLQSVTTTTTTPPATYIASTPPEANGEPPEAQGDKWDQLAQCECGGNWSCNTGNGYGGGLQFMHQPSYSTWLSFGGGDYAPHPWEATREQQIVVAERVLESSGWRAWPGCARKYGWLR